MAWGVPMSRDDRKIVCIEDDRETNSLIAEELSDRFGCPIIQAHDGREGLAAILRERPDLVLCDISMPGMTGFDVIEGLAAMAPPFARIPFIFLTALADRENELKGRRLGADDYVVKPVDFDILDAIIRARLARSPKREDWPDGSHLTEREIESLTWAARGKTSAEIALILSISKRTVDFHLDNAREKLGVATRVEAAIKAASGGLIEP
jgi:DNA-binding NarL/FixJ family response regulator